MTFRKRVSMIGASTTVAAFLLTSGMIAQQPPAGQAGQKGSSMAMGDMMKQCQTHCQQTNTAINQARKEVETARQSNDPAKMSTALDDLDKQLSGMGQHMSSCVNMMKMMQMMQNKKQ